MISHPVHVSHHISGAPVQEKKAAQHMPPLDSMHAQQEIAYYLGKSQPPEWHVQPIRLDQEFLKVPESQEPGSGWVVETKYKRSHVRTDRVIRTQRANSWVSF